MIIPSGINVTHSLSRRGTETGVSVVDFIRGLASARFPYSSMLFVFKGFCRLDNVLFNSIHNSNPRGGPVLKQRSDLNFRTSNDLHGNKRKCSRLGQFSYSYESSLLLEISDRYAAAYILCINVPLRSVLLHQV